MEHQLARARVEVKYRLSSASAKSLITALREADLPQDVRPQRSWVTTVYVDHPDLRLVRAARPNPRFARKLRLREYFDDEGAERSSVVWLELKECEGDSSRKYRFALPKARVSELLTGTLDPDEILRYHPVNAEDVADTLRRIREVAPGAIVPVGTVRYRRFSVQGGTPCGRLTVDEQISYTVGGATTMEEGAVAEVKHAAGSMPSWCASYFRRRAPVGYSKFGVISGMALSESFAR